MDLLILSCNLELIMMIEHLKHGTVICTGGWYCYDHQSCLTRWQRMRHLMTSHHWPETRSGMYVTEIPTMHVTEGNIMINMNINPLKHRGNFIYFQLYHEITLSTHCISEFLATDPKVRVRFLALPDFLRSSGSGTGSTQPREYNREAT
jgi:hypothetical protein